MQASIWQTFFILTLWKVSKPPGLPRTSADLPVCKYKNNILPLRLMVNMWLLNSEDSGTWRFLLASQLLRPQRSPYPNPMDASLLFPFAGRASSEAAPPVYVQAQAKTEHCT